eukprot:3871712-Prymnesium_polylepis.1
MEQQGVSRAVPPPIAQPALRADEPQLTVHVHQLRLALATDAAAAEPDSHPSERVVADVRAAHSLSLG